MPPRINIYANGKTSQIIKIQPKTIRRSAYIIYAQNWQTKMRSFVGTCMRTIVYKISAVKIINQISMGCMRKFA